MKRFDTKLYIKNVSDSLFSDAGIDREEFYRRSKETYCKTYKDFIKPFIQNEELDKIKTNLAHIVSSPISISSSIAANPIGINNMISDYDIAINI